MTDLFSGATVVPRRALRLARLAVPVLALCLGLAHAVHAQDHRVGLTGYMGTAAYGSFAADSDPDVRLAPGGFYSATAELWFGRFGIRLHGGLASPGLEDDPDTGFDLHAGDASLVARLRRPRAGQFFQPYAVLGLGAIRYELGTDADAVGGFAYHEDPTTRGTLVLGIGTDLGSGPVAVRVELLDIIGLSSPLSRDNGSDFGPVSHVILSLGLSFRAGSLGVPPREREDPRQPVVTRLRPTAEPEGDRPGGG